MNKFRSNQKNVFGAAVGFVGVQVFAVGFVAVIFYVAMVSIDVVLLLLMCVVKVVVGFLAVISGVTIDFVCVVVVCIV